MVTTPLHSTKGQANHLMRAAISSSMEQSAYDRITSPAVAIWVITVFNMLAYIYLSLFNF